MSADPVIISGIRPSRLIPLEPSVSEVHVGVDFGAGDSCTQFHQIQVVNPCKPCGEAELDILKLRVGAVMPMSSVPELKIETVGQDHQAAEEGLSDATKRILDAYAEACARWFSAMRACIRRERVRQALFREEHGLPRTAKIPYQRQPLTAEELAVSSMAEAIARCMFGQEVADYARQKFLHAIDTGDMRAFKIRLVVIKARDCLKKLNSPITPEFLKGMEKCIEKAESLAGCIPDPSPRRMSKAEQERRRKKEESEKAMREMQPELPLVWPEHSSEPSTVQDIEHASDADADLAHIPVSPKMPLVRKSQSKGEKGESPHVSEVKQDIGNVTVTVTGESGESGRKASRKRSKGSGIVRKAREYNTVEQILDDIEEGRIVPYESSDEICADLNAGMLTPVEALMFANALDRYSPQDSDGEDDPDRSYLERESVGVDDDDEDDEEDDLDSGEGSSFSYNPNGFGGEPDGLDSEDQW